MFDLTLHIRGTDLDTGLMNQDYEITLDIPISHTIDLETHLVDLFEDGVHAQSHCRSNTDDLKTR